MNSLLERIAVARESELLEVLYAAVGGDPSSSVELLSIAREEGYPTELILVVSCRLRCQGLLWAGEALIAPDSYVGLTHAGINSIINPGGSVVWRQPLRALQQREGIHPLPAAPSR
ncbi:MAG: hypothetical protein LBG44_02295 [Gemmatimonadota bacterium]|jgi:hypothetical protein|nr:hypothetical protein [Gemmatimonadota bacterium]